MGHTDKWGWTWRFDVLEDGVNDWRRLQGRKKERVAFGDREGEGTSRARKKVDMYSIFYNNIINIRVLLII